MERWHRPLGAIERSHTAVGRQAELQMLPDRFDQWVGSPNVGSFEASIAGCMEPASRRRHA